MAVRNENDRVNGPGKEPDKDWRDLCAAAAGEPDSQKLVALVHQILEAFDERDQAAPGSSSTTGGAA